MNKKIYLSALVLPAVFSACTQDDLTGLESNAQQQRVTLAEVTFADNIESRLAFENQGSFNNFSLKPGDAIGAYLIDVPTSTIVTDQTLEGWNNSGKNEYEIETGLKAAYGIQRTISGSHKFVYADGQWTTLDQMVEGNYLYVLPYQEKKTRELITTELPQIQYLKYKQGTTTLDDLSLMNQVVESGQPLAVGYEFLSRYNSQVSGQLKQIYAYPMITFLNGQEQSVEVQKVVINSEAGFQLKGTINLENAATMLYNLDSDPNKNNPVESTIAGRWMKSVAGNYYVGEGNYTENIVDAVGDPVDFIVVIAPENLTVAPGASISFQAVIPADAYGAGDLRIDVYTNKGVFSHELTTETKFNNALRYSAANYEDGNRITDNVDNEDTLVDESKNGYDLGVAKEETTKLEAVVVVNTADLLDVIAGETEGTAVVPANINVIPMTDVVINKDVISALGDKKALTVTQDINIVGTDEGLVVKNVDFGDKTATVTEGNVTFQNATLQNLIVEKDASVEVNKGFSSGVSIKNEGTLKINNKTDLGAAQKTTFGVIENLGVLNIETPLKATTVYNGTVEEVLYADVVTSAEINAGANIEATVENYGKFYVDKSISVDVLNNQKVTGASNNSKAGEVEIAVNYMLKTEGLNEGKITVDGEFRAVGAFENSGEILNNYGMENVYGVELDNVEGGYITVGTNAKYTSVNNNEGIIEILNRESEIHADLNPGTILYTAEDDRTFTVLATDKYNTVKFNESKTLKVYNYGDDETLQGKADALAAALTVKLNAEGNYAFETTIKGLAVVEDIYATIISDVTITESIEIGEGAQLHLGTNTVMNYNKSEGFVNAGTFRNMGKLNAMCNQPEGSFVGSGKYNWGQVNEAATSKLQEILNDDNNEEGEVTLSENVILNESLSVSQSLTLDMNGKTLEMSTNGATYGAAIEADGSEVTLTIDGDGFIDGGADDNGTESYRNAVVAKNGATINIESGKYTLTQGANALIYALEGTINISGGYFYIANKKDANDPGTSDVYCLLNCYDKNYKDDKANINVTGGVFKNFNPANNFAEGTGTSFINNSTHRVDSYVDEECTNRKKKNAVGAWTGGTDYWYKVVENNAE